MCSDAGLAPSTARALTCALPAHEGGDVPHDRQRCQAHARAGDGPERIDPLRLRPAIVRPPANGAGASAAAADADACERETQLGKNDWLLMVCGSAVVILAVVVLV